MLTCTSFFIIKRYYENRIIIFNYFHIFIVQFRNIPIVLLYCVVMFYSHSWPQVRFQRRCDFKELISSGAGDFSLERMKGRWLMKQVYKEC